FSNHSLLKIYKGVFKIRFPTSSYTPLVVIVVNAVTCAGNFLNHSILLVNTLDISLNPSRDELSVSLVIAPLPNSPSLTTEACVADSAWTALTLEAIKVEDKTANGITEYLRKCCL